MLARIHAKSDVLENGKIMLFMDCEPGCRVVTDLEYSEHALREVLVDTYKTIAEVISGKNDLPVETYVDLLATLTKNLKMVTDSLLAIKADASSRRPKEPNTFISESIIKEVFNYSAVQAR